MYKLASDYDGVFLHKRLLKFFDALWLRFYARKIIYDFDDAVMYDPDAPKRNSFTHIAPLNRTVKLADLVIAGNSYLADHAKKSNLNVEILPTGLDTRAYQIEIDRMDDGKIRLVWIGSKSTLRYLAEIKPALEEIGLRFNNVVIRIICDEFFDLKNMQVEKHHWASQTEVIDLITSDIALSPLPDNRFTRGKCGFKILQYGAAGLPVVTSPVGTNAEYVQDGMTGCYASTISQWVDKISELVENTEKRKRMGEAARMWAQNFDMGIIGRQLAELVTKCLQNSAS